MKVHSINNQNINHRGLKISYQAEYKIRNAEPSLIKALLKVGKEHEGNQYIDILVLKNLAYRIKEKANPFFCIKEPFHLKKISDNKLNIAAVYDGVEDDVHLKGDKFNINIDFENSKEIDEIVGKFTSMRGLQRVSVIAKLIENYFSKTKGESHPTNGDRDALATLLLDRYADIVV